MADRTKPSPRTLVLMRHSKAEQTGATDFERELSPGGTSDAAATGEWLSDEGITPDCAVVSAATRTQQTWAAVAGSAGWQLDVTYDHGLYAADPDTALDVLRTIDDRCRSVVVVGHNPTVAYLAQLLDDGDGDLEAANAMSIGFPTSAVAVFTYEGSWSDLAPATARIASFHVARAESA